MKKLFLLISTLFLTACNGPTLAVKPSGDVALDSYSYSPVSQQIKIVDNRSEESKKKGPSIKKLNGYRFGDAQLKLDRRLLLEEHLNTNIRIDTPTTISLEEFSLHHVEPEDIRVSTRKAGDPDWALGATIGIGGALGSLIGDALQSAQSETHSNGDPYFLCTIKVKAQGKKTNVRYYLDQDYFSELNPEKPFSSEKYRNGLQSTIDTCLEKIAEKVASTKRFSGFSLVTNNK